MSKAYLFLVGVLSLAASARAAPVYVIETGKPRQTIRHFGASDCWSMWQIGKWDAAKQKHVADWLFSLETDTEGRPLGIGLSLWRFNLGAGSPEQGDASQINLWTRTECLLSPDGTWNWDKQRAERNFLKLAKARGRGKLQRRASPRLCEERDGERKGGRFETAVDVRQLQPLCAPGGRARAAVSSSTRRRRRARSRWCRAHREIRQVRRQDGGVEGFAPNGNTKRK